MPLPTKETERKKMKEQIEAGKTEEKLKRKKRRKKKKTEKDFTKLCHNDPTLRIKGSSPLKVEFCKWTEEDRIKPLNQSILF